MNRLPRLRLGSERRTRLAALLLLIATPAAADYLPEPGLPSAPQVRCAGNDEIEVSGRQLRARGNAIEAHGNCRVWLIDSHVVADGIAVFASGNAEVTIEGSFVQGSQQVVKVTGNAVVRHAGSTLRGATLAAAGGELLDNGGSQVERLPRPPSAPLQSAAAVRCTEDGERLRLLHRSIIDPSDAIEVGKGCELTLSDSLVRADGWAIRIAEGGRVTLRNCVIEGGEGAIEVAAGGYLHWAGSTVEGGIHVRGHEALAVDGGGNAATRR